MTWDLFNTSQIKSYHLLWVKQLVICQAQKQMGIHECQSLPSQAAEKLVGFNTSVLHFPSIAYVEWRGSAIDCMLQSGPDNT